MPTRRQLLLRAGAVGGASAVYALAETLGLFKPQSAYGSPAPSGFAMNPVASAGCPTRVVVVGAGVGGLVVAYELERAGYDVTILEASGRIGGRNLTARRGTVIDELGNPQRCEFDDDPNLYFNCGPARLPGSHRRVLEYCRQFGVELENFVNKNPNAYVMSSGFNGGHPMRQREYLADAKGFLAEFASKGISDRALDKTAGAEDIDRLTQFVATYGDLGQDNRYHGTARAGFASGGLLKPGVQKEPSKSISDLLKTPYWRFPMFFTEGESQFPAMMQPVGGMDRIVTAFVQRLRRPVHTNAVVRSIQLRDKGVDIAYVKDGKPLTISADACFNCMPGHLVNGLEHNFPPEFRAIIQQMRGPKLSKVGLQMKQRFWESEEIYGGITWTDNDLLQIWYPSHGALLKKGVVLGGYVFGNLQNDRFSRKDHAQRIEAALSMGERVHPGRYRASFETGVSISWQRYNHMLGCGSGFSRRMGEPLDAETTKKILTLQEPLLGRYYMIGDQVSFHPGWQEGAVAIAHAALEKFQRNQARFCA